MKKRTYIDAICKRCSKQFRAIAYEVKIGNGKYCSYSCARKNRPVANQVDRFWDKVNQTNLGCWEWIAGKSRTGYGCFTRKPEKSILAHRYSWILHHGNIPQG